jgi:hypothetical protein
LKNKKRHISKTRVEHDILKKFMKRKKLKIILYICRIFIKKILQNCLLSYSVYIQIWLNLFVDDRQLGKKNPEFFSLRYYYCLLLVGTWDLLFVCLFSSSGFFLLIQLPLFGPFLFPPLFFHRPFRHSGRTSNSIPKKKKTSG